MEENVNLTGGACNTKKHLRGVKCEVADCTFNNGKHECCANEICVGPCGAHCSAETVCATFKPKTY